MEQATIDILQNFALGLGVNFTTEGIKTLFSKAFTLKPDLEKELQKVETSLDIEKIFRDAIGVIEAKASDKELKVFGAELKAINGIKFNHESGEIIIGDTTISSKVLVTGGIDGSTGKTEILENTKLKASGSSIDVGKNASIEMSGGASITMT